MAKAKDTAAAAAALPDVPEGMIRLCNPDATGCSYGGAAYDADESGNVVVPAEAASALLPHGFTVAEA